MTSQDINEVLILPYTEVNNEPFKLWESEALFHLTQGVVKVKEIELIELRESREGCHRTSYDIFQINILSVSQFPQRESEALHTERENFAEGNIRHLVERRLRRINPDSLQVFHANDSFELCSESGITKAKIEQRIFAIDPRFVRTE